MTVNLWKVDTNVIEKSVSDGGIGVTPFVPLIEGGRNGEFYQDMIDFFYYAQIRAQGEQALQAKEMQLTQMEMSEEARVQQAEAAGKQFMFEAQEQRDMATMDRMSGQEAQARQDIANANAAQQAATAGIISGIGGIVTAGIGSGQLGLPKPKGQ